MRYISSSLPRYLKKLSAIRINLQLSGVYPLREFTLSMLGEKLPAPMPLLSVITKGMPVNSHFPVQRVFPQSYVRENSSPLFRELSFAPLIRDLYGKAIFLSKRVRIILARSFFLFNGDKLARYLSPFFLACAEELYILTHSLHPPLVFFSARCPCLHGFPVKYFGSPRANASLRDIIFGISMSAYPRICGLGIVGCLTTLRFRFYTTNTRVIK